MKNKKIVVCLIAAIFGFSTVSFSQEVIASAKEDKEKEKEKEKSKSVSPVVAADSTTPEGENKKQDEPKTFTLSGSIDIYAHTSLGKRNATSVDADPRYGYGPTTSFANLKGFALGMANLIATYQGEKAGFTADLVFGPRGSDAVFLSGGYGNLAGAGSGQIVNQLFAYYKVSDKVTFNLGQFNTFVGYEVISPTLNQQYSTSYLFSNGPFNHTGFRVDFTGESGIVAKLAIMNPTDILEFNPVNTYTLGGQLGYTNDGGGIWLNLIYGDQDGKLDADAVNPVEGSPSAGALFQVDLTTGWSLGEKFYLGFNTSFQTIAAGEEFDGNDVVDSEGDASSFLGAAIYPKLILSENSTLGLRAEYFSAKKFHPLASVIALDDEGEGNVIALTLSGNFKLADGLTIIPEIRMDKMSEDFFYTTDGDISDSIISATFAAVYKF